LEAKLTRDTELFGEMDPFIIIEYQGMEFKTRTADNAGKNPKWNEYFEIEIYSLQDDIKI
jgi:Ca2+-dependent lipid-binding protein